jgi:aspartate/methionine/tyrosine aminotransferase
VANVTRFNPRLRPFGSTVFSEITARATAAGAINLGQGFPNFDGPDFVKEAAIEAIRGGMGQYAPTNGLPALATAIADCYRDVVGDLDPDRNVTVTSGCTEALASTFLGVLQPEEAVILIEPTYDAYPADLALAGGRPQFLTLRPPEFRLDPEELDSLVTPATKAIVVNTPHNPSGRVLSTAELEGIADVCQRHDLIAITDEVYEHMVYEGSHISLAGLDGMWERTITLSSLGKTFSLTGWKIGWAVAPDELTKAIRSAHQFLTFATATPLQHAAAVALRAPAEYFSELRDSYLSKRNLLASGLMELGFQVFTPQGTYFLMADHRHFGDADDISFVHRLIDEVGVAAIPPSAFYHEAKEAQTLVRFAFCKDEETLRQALDRLADLRPLAG